MMTPEEEIYALIERTAESNYDGVTLPKTEEFVLNSRGQRLHLRTSWPVDEPKALVLALHGYCAHCNRPSFRYFAKTFNENGIAVVMVDFHGHGYSEGMRAYIENPNHLPDDALSALVAVYSKEKESSNHKIAHKASANTPLFIMGQSMGGTTALFTSEILSHIKQQNSSRNDIHNDGKPNDDDKEGSSRHPSATEAPLSAAVETAAVSVEEFVIDDIIAPFLNRGDGPVLELIAHKFTGSVLVCPAIQVFLPHFSLIFLLEYVITPLLPAWSLPDFLDNMDDGKIFANPHYLKYAQNDRDPVNNPNALSWEGKLRFRTASTMLALTVKVRDVIAPRVSFPFLALHDPKDVVTSFEGSEILMKASRTTDAEKELVRMDGGLHDLYMNRMSDVAKHAVDFVKKILAAAK